MRIGSLGPRDQRRFRRRHRSRASPSSTWTRRASISSPTPRRSCPATASTTARSTAKAASGPGRWTIASARRPARSIGSIPTVAGTTIDSGYRVTNGPAFSRDGRTMYHKRSARGSSPMRSTSTRPATPANRRDFIQFGEGDGYPDGMTVDAEDCLWIAFWDGWCVRRFSPAGECLADDRRCPSSGRPAAPSAAPISTALHHLGEPRPRATSFAMQPFAGGLFMSVPGVAGIAELPFAG